MGRAVFLDRDGVLVEPVLRNGEISSARTMEEFRVILSVKEPLLRLRGAGFDLVVVSNQPDVARKKLDPEILERMNEALVLDLGGGPVIRAVYTCPHDAKDCCACRKPKAGLLVRAAGDWRIDLDRSFLIGDRAVDMEAARAVSVTPVLLDAPYNQGVAANFRARDFAAACDWILA
jgi:D-glycero-D-manno-heptose 1,7-bisphosphate phosphatase